MSHNPTRAPAPEKKVATPGTDAPPATLLPGMTSAQRKEFPLVTGCLDYFPHALLAVSHISFRGNKQHNPGMPLHWNRAKSTDEVDALGRHLTERDGFDENGSFIAAQVAWRALSDCQKALEKLYNLPPPRGCKPK